MKKKNRIRKSMEFQELIHSGRKAANASFVYYSWPRKEAQARIGISLSRKMGHAVDRNLFKRQVRMMCQELVDFASFERDGVLIVRFGYRSRSYEENKKNLEKLLCNTTIR